MTELDTQTTPGQAPAPQVPHGEPCQECGAPLAVDQRYCLNCGRRRGDARVDYRHYMSVTRPGEPGGPAPAQATSSPDPAADRSIDPTVEGSKRQSAEKERDYAPLAAVGGIAVLGLMLLVGVLIGRGGDNSAPTPTRVVVPSGSGEAKASAGAGEEGAAAKPGTGAAAKPGGKGKGSASGGGSAKGEEPVQASAEALESLHSQSGASYEEQSKKLPNKIATPGKPPPIDKTTPPGGGEGGGEVIK